MFEIRRNEVGTVVLEGRLDAAQEEKARVVLDSLEDTTVLDCKDLSYIASAGLGILLRAQKRLQARGKTLRIANLNPHLREIFKMVSFDRIFQLEREEGDRELPLPGGRAPVAGGTSVAGQPSGLLTV